MNATTTARIFAKGYELNTAESSFGELRRSADIQTDSSALRQRWVEDGYLFIPGFFERSAIQEARRHIAEVLASKDLLDPNCPVMDAVKAADADMGFQSDPRLAVEFMNSISKDNATLQRLLYSGK